MDDRKIVELGKNAFRSVGREEEKYAIREERKNNGDVSTICIISSESYSRVKIDDIEMIDRDGRKLNIYTGDRVYTVYENINVLAERLVERGFYRPISGLIINFDKVREIDSAYITFMSGRNFVLGRNNFYKTKSAFKRYLQRYPPFMNWEPQAQLAENQIDESGYETEKNNDNMMGEK